MKKIPTIFIRDMGMGNGKITQEWHPDALWVRDGEGTASVKVDGSCCLIEGGKLFKRYDAKRGKTPPAGFIPAQEPDPVTGHHPGWLEVGEGPEDKWHREGLARTISMGGVPDGTYELCGPKLQGNPERLEYHELIPHGMLPVDPPRTYDGLRVFLDGLHREGIVWKHPDGRMAKIKRRDFGYRWP
jgi:hypothetical protein